MGLDRVEDLFKGEVEYLVHLVERLHADGKRHEAKGVFMRHGLKIEDFNKSTIGRSKQGLARDIENLKYDASKDYKPPVDMFDPVSTPVQEYLRLPVDLAVDFISKEKDIQKLEVLVGKPFVGVDSEWRPQITRWHNTKGIAILQLGTSNEAFIVDLLALKTSKKLDEMLLRIFTHKKTKILGFGFSADMS